MTNRFAAALLVLLAVAATARAGDTYTVDKVHSSVNFKIQHANAGYVFGRFDDFSGSVVEDSDPSKMTFEFTVKVDSVDTNMPQRDTHLKSNTFFSVGEFPTITFKSTSVKSTGDKKFEVTGDLTLHGQTKSITTTVEKTGASETKMFGTRVGYLATFSVKRSDFGMDAMQEAVGDEVGLMVALEAKK